MTSRHQSSDAAIIIITLLLISLIETVLNCLLIKHDACYTAALGQAMLYVDGMNGVISHIGTIQWLYTLCAAKVGITRRY